MTPDEFLRSFRPAPIYVFCGEEEFHKVEGLSLIRKTILPGEPDAMGFTELDGDEVDMATVLDELRSLSLFGGSRVVVLRGADNFFGLKGKASGSDASAGDGERDEPGTSGKAKTHRDLLLKYLGAPVKGAALVILTQEKWSRAVKLAKRIGETGFLVECTRPYESEIPRWLTLRAQHHGKKLVGRAAELFAQSGISSLLELDTQIVKLATYVGSRTQITEEDVAALVAHTGQQSIFKLTDAVAARNPGKAVAILRDLLFRGAAEAYIITMLAWQFRRLWQAKKLEAAGQSPREIAEELKLSPYQQRYFFPQLRQFTEADLRRNHRLLLDADLAAKTGAEPDVVVEQLVIRVCQSPGTPSRRTLASAR